MDALIVRALAVAEWDLFRNLRLIALKDAPGVFATSYADAVKRAPETWQSLVSGPTNQIFGLFAGAHLVGITGAFAWPDDASGETATLVMSYLSRRIAAVAYQTYSIPPRSTGYGRILVSRASWSRCAPAAQPRGALASGTALRRSRQRCALGLMPLPRMK